MGKEINTCWENSKALATITQKSSLISICGHSGAKKGQSVIAKTGSKRSAYLEVKWMKQKDDHMEGKSSHTAVRAIDGRMDR